MLLPIPLRRYLDAQRCLDATEGDVTTNAEREQHLQKDMQS